MQNEPYRLRYANQIVGVFLLMLLALVMVVAVAVTRDSGILVKPVKYTVASMTEKEASDLRTGTDVVILGKRIGEVSSLEYADAGDQVTIGLGIDPKYANLITTDSVFSLERRFGVGAVYVRIKRQASADRSEPRPLDPSIPIRLASGEVDRVEQIATDVSKASNSIGGIETKLTPTLESVQAASDQFRSSVKDSFAPAAEESKVAFNSIANTSEELRARTTELSQQLAELTLLISALAKQDVPSTLNALRESSSAAATASRSLAKTAENLDTKTDKTNADVAQTLKSMREALVQIQKLTTESRELVNSLRGTADELPDTVDGVNRTVDDTQDMVNEIRSHWLLRNVRMDSSGVRQVPPSSIRTGGSQ